MRSIFYIIIILLCLYGYKALSIARNVSRSMIANDNKNITINETLNKKIVQSIVLNSISVSRLAAKSITSCLSIIKLSIGLPIILIMNIQKIYYL